MTASPLTFPRLTTMTATRTDPAIRPADGTSYRQRPLPDELATVLAYAMDTDPDEAPETLEGLLALDRQAGVFHPDEQDAEAMLVTGDSRHAVHLAEGPVHTYCVLDAFVLAMLQDEPVTVVTRPPGGEEAVELVVSDQGAWQAGEAMVVSFGFQASMPQDEAAFADASQAEILETTHEHGCPAMNLFPDREAYEAWARRSEAVTVPLGLAEALALARDTVEHWRQDGPLEASTGGGSP